MKFFFYNNSLKACIIYLNILMFNEKKEIKFDLDNCNYYDLDKLFKCAIDFIENDLKNEINRDNDIIIKEKKYHMMNLFIKTCLIIFIFFSNDLIIFAPVLESDSVKLHKNIFKFFCKLINVLFLLLKNYHQYIKKELTRYVCQIPLSIFPFYKIILNSIQNLYTLSLIIFLMQ